MNRLSQVYRQACRELALPDDQQALLQKLLRELAVNIARRQLAWNNKEQFITLWFISAGRFPELSGTSIAEWVVRQLPFYLDADELKILKS
ncbi:MAG TPA: hypothetical protein VHB54_18420 [Mucilaginibacter sp.]|nr:hypothetical protein [Mucilaginibacter sp.]